MEWHEYVRQVMGNDRQVDAAARTGLDQATISRWLHPATSLARRTSQSVRAFALGYEQSVLQAFVVAGFLTAEEAGTPAIPVVNVREVIAHAPAHMLFEDLNRRLGS